MITSSFKCHALHYYTVQYVINRVGHELREEYVSNMSSLGTFFTSARDNEGRFSGEGGTADHEGS